MRRLTSLLSLAALVLFSAPAYADGPWHVSKSLAPGAEKTPPSASANGHHTVIPNVHYKLKNGLKVILYEDHTLPQVRVSIWYRVGACYEKPGLTGMAHLFEHLMFEGSRDLEIGVTAGQYSQMHNLGVFSILEGTGATGLNGETGFEHTMYFETMPSENLKTALWLESDRMGFLVINQKRLDKQRKIVNNELRQRIETVPYAKAEQEVWHHLFPKGHPCDHDPAGTIGDLAHAKLADLTAFHTRAYSPANATLVLAGDLPKNTKKMIAKYFGTLPARPGLPRIKAPPVILDHQIVLHHKDKLARRTLVTLSWHSPAVFAPGDAEADLAAVVLSGSPDTRLKRALVDTGLALDAGAGIQHQGFGSVFRIEFEPRPGVAPEKVVAKIDEVLADLAKHVDPAELARARMRLETSKMAGLQGLNRKAYMLHYYSLYTGEPDGFYADISRLTKVTPASLSAFIGKTLDPHHRVEMIVVPEHPAPPPPTAKTPPPAKSPAPTPAAAKPVAKEAS